MATRIEGIAGIVLAGGLSSRMGRDKAQLRLHGQTLLQRSCVLLRQAGVVTLRVSGPYPEHGGIADRVPRCGPLGGLHAVLPTLDDGWAWVVPVDMPTLGVEQLRRLRDAAPSSGAVFSDYPLPMLLNIDSRCRTLIEARMQDVDAPRSLHALQRALGFVQVTPRPGDFSGLVNCNTPEQWKDAAT